MNTRVEHGFEKLEACILCGCDSIVDFDKEIDFCRCTSCGLVFDNPRPTQALIWEHYSRKGKYDSWIDRTPAFDRYWNGYLKRLLKYKKSGDLLDIGAGIGMFLSKAKNHFTVTGTEVSDEGISVAKERYSVELIKGSLDSIDFGEKKFDVITMSQILEHVPFPGQTLDSVKSLLKPDGVLYISVPNESRYSFRLLIAGLFSFLKLKRFKDFKSHGFRKLVIGVIDEIHLSHFSPAILKKALESRGFSVLETTLEFHDLFMGRKGAVQIVRHGMYLLSHLIKVLSGVYTYNSFGIIAKNISHEST